MLTNYRKYKSMQASSIWAEIINEARLYDGTPHDLQKYIDHFDSKYSIDIKCETIEKKRQNFGLSLSEFKNDYPREMLKEFRDYWCESSPNSKKLRYEKEKVFDIKLRLVRWKKNNNGKQISKHKPNIENVTNAAEALLREHNNSKYGTGD